MKHSRTLIIFSLVLVSLALACQAAKDAAQQQTSSASLASKLKSHTRARTARSLSDMFEKVKSKIFGKKQQATAASSAAGSSSSASSQVQSATSAANAAQRQPWADLNSFNQQYNPYSPLGANYQWPAASSSASNQFQAQQYNPMGSYLGASAGSQSAYPGLSSMMPGLDGQQPPQQVGSQQQQQQQQQSLGPAANSNGGLLSSASHLIAQYLSPSSGAGASSGQPGAALGQSSQVGPSQANGQAPNMLSPQQQQQQQSQYNEFASILDSMVAQTGAGSPQQRQPSMNQYLGNGQAGQAGPGPQQQQAMQALPQQQQQQQGYQPGPAGSMMGSNPTIVGDNEMSGSSNIQSYMPAATQQQASAKSSMVSLAEQLAPGAQFNKLVSFPFSLSNNDDPAKEGKYKLHIPFLNQHVKRSDQQQQQQAAAAAAANSVSSANQQQQQLRQQQQYLNSHMNQQQYSNSVSQQQPMVAQSSQVVPTIVSPQSSSVSQSQSSSAVSSAQSAAIPASASASVSSGSGVVSNSASSAASAPNVAASNPQ